MERTNLWTDKRAAANNHFAKAGLSFFYDSEVLNSSFVHLLKFNAIKHPGFAKRQIVSSYLNIKPTQD